MIGNLSGELAVKSERKYRKPPVIEALCELYFTESAWDDTVVGRFYDLVKGDFPVKRQLEMQEAQVTLSTTGEAAAGLNRLAPRMQFVSSKGERMIQLSRDLLVVNQLRLYSHPRFEEWEPVIYQALAHYRALAAPKSVNRLGVRYINRVVIPERSIHMEDYYQIYPQLPQFMGDSHGSFMIRVDITNQKGGHSVLVTFASAPPEKPGEIAHLLDLYDVARFGKMVQFDEISEQVRMGHENVEAAFEGSITEKLRILFEPEES